MNEYLVTMTLRGGDFGEVTLWAKNPSEAEEKALDRVAEDFVLPSGIDICEIVSTVKRINKNKKENRHAHKRHL